MKWTKEEDALVAEIAAVLVRQSGSPYQAARRCSVSGHALSHHGYDGCLRRLKDAVAKAQKRAAQARKDAARKREKRAKVSASQALAEALLEHPVSIGPVDNHVQEVS